MGEITVVFTPTEKEARAIGTVGETLDGLTPEAQSRVLQWAVRKYVTDPRGGPYRRFDKEPF